MPSIDSQTVMFYYDDLQQASEFYEQILGLEKTLDFEWVKFYRISGSSHVGIVRAGDGAYHSPQSNNAVMLSIVTSEVDAWYERLKVQDPGGYTVEFFQWLEQP
jgi:catechol 2,3-dioxygenase-like lactoylglutathione lyase family enzyme